MTISVSKLLEDLKFNQSLIAQASDLSAKNLSTSQVSIEQSQASVSQAASVFNLVADTFTRILGMIASFQGGTTPAPENLTPLAGEIEAQRNMLQQAVEQQNVVANNLMTVSAAIAETTSTLGKISETAAASTPTVATPEQPIPPDLETPMVESEITTTAVGEAVQEQVSDPQVQTEEILPIVSEVTPPEIALDGAIALDIDESFFED